MARACDSHGRWVRKCGGGEQVERAQCVVRAPHWQQQLSQMRRSALAARADGISAKGALEADQFLFVQRQTRSNMLSEAMVAVIIEVWHSEEVSRRNANTSDVKKASKHRDAAQHPAQVQIRTAADAVQRRTAYS
eukprot:TRINITY_DN7262_c0_g1_i2.p1 TRINITY_DN7262_c0_g1~~TRINITY_DN7262_c0_g1_i2.p1  ORF type:complete len:135 (-),score=19.81 TRINITY_DN7262_c0_g1_i2:3-407(-)